MEIYNEDAINNYGKQQQELIWSVRKSLDLETDRGACIIACDLLDKMLEDLLRKKLLGSNNLKKDLFNLNGPLGTFSSKIKLSYSIGLIHKEVLNDLEIIRGFRNIFSHSHLYIDFNTNEILPKIRSLKNHIREAEIDKPRNIFSNTLVSLAIAIFNSDLLLRKFKEPELPEFLSEEHRQEIIDDAIKDFKEKPK